MAEIWNYPSLPQLTHAWTAASAARVFGGQFVEGAPDHGGLDGPGAAHASVGGGQVLHHSEFDAIGGLEAVQMLAEHGLERFAGFFRQDHALGQKTVTHGVAGRTEFSLGRSGTSGARAVWPAKIGFV